MGSKKITSIAGHKIIGLVTSTHFDPDAREGVETDVETFYLLKNGATVGQKFAPSDGLTLGAGVHIDGTAKIGTGVTIGSFAQIADDVTIGDGCQIGSHSVIDHETTLGPNCVIGTRSYVGPLNNLPADLYLPAYSAIMGESGEEDEIARIAPFIGKSSYTVIFARFGNKLIAVA